MLRKAICTVAVLVILLVALNSSLAEEKDKVLAKVGEIKITQGYFDSIIEDMPPQYRAKWTTPEGKRQLLEIIIDIKLFCQEAHRIKLDEDPKVKTKIETMTERVLSSEYMKHLTAQIKIEEDELKNYYENHKGEFQQPEQVKARHILVKTEEEAKAIQKELKKGKDFAQLAKEKSTCPSKERGGDLDWFSRGQMIPEFEKATFSLKKGEVSGIVHTEFGYHIIKVEDRTEARQKIFNEVKSKIKTELQQQKEKETIEEAKAMLRKKAKVEVFEEALK